MAKTSRTFAIMQYMEYMGGVSYTDYENSLFEKYDKGEIEHAKSLAMKLHDKDIKGDGTPKPPHFHAVITFTQPKTFKTVASIFGVEEQYVEKIKTSTKAAQLYLIHHNDKSKHQYDPKEVRATFDYLALVEDTPTLENMVEILHDIEEGLIRPYNIVEKVGIEFYTKYKRRLLDAFEYVERKKGGINRDMKCFYFYGESGSGKTTYAKMFASQNGWSTFVSSGGKNPFDDYRGQDCVILDDIRGSLFSLADFLKLTDNNTDSMVGCRYYNKSLSYCKAIICTSVLSLEDLYSGVTDEHKEPLKQLIRRFELVIRFEEKTMTLLEPLSDYSGLRPKVKVVNPVAALFNTEVAKNVAENFIKAMGLEVIEDKPSDPCYSLKDFCSMKVPSMLFGGSYPETLKLANTQGDTIELFPKRHGFTDSTPYCYSVMGKLPLGYSEDDTREVWHVVV